MDGAKLSDEEIKEESAIEEEEYEDNIEEEIKEEEVLPNHNEEIDEDDDVFLIPIIFSNDEPEEIIPVNNIEIKSPILDKDDKKEENDHKVRDKEDQTHVDDSLDQPDENEINNIVTEIVKYQDDNIPPEQLVADGKLGSQEAAGEKETREDEATKMELTKTEEINDLLSSSLVTNEEFRTIISENEVETQVSETQIETQIDDLKSSNPSAPSDLKSKSENSDYYPSCIMENLKIRNELILSLRAMKMDYQNLIHYNRHLQCKIADSLLRKKLEIGLEIIEVTDLNLIAQAETRYTKLLDVVKEYHMKHKELSQKTHNEIEVVKAEVTNVKQSTEEKWEHYCKYRREKLKYAIWTQNNKKLKPEEINLFMSDESEMEEKVRKARLNVIHWEQEVAKKNAEYLSNGSELESVGLKTIDYEQMKQESSVLRCRFDSRSCEIKKIRKKISTINGSLTHIKESLSNKKQKVQLMKTDMKELSRNLDMERKTLNNFRILRNNIKNKNTTLIENSGLIGRELLLENFERNVLELRSLKKRFTTIHNNYVDTAHAIINFRMRTESFTQQNEMRLPKPPKIVISTSSEEEPSFHSTLPVINTERKISCLPTPYTQRPCKPSMLRNHSSFN